MANELQKKYEEKIRTALMDKYHYKSVMQIPRMEKIVINAGVGDATKDAKFIEAMYNEIQNITGQKPIKTKAKKAIATYRLREGQDIGVKVTLRGANMWNFVDKLINIALPRVRDFKGVPKRSFDGHGNYTLGVKEQIIFNEINFDDVKRVRGFDCTFVMSKGNDEESLALLTAIGMPFVKR